MIIQQAQSQGMRVHMPPRKNRKDQRKYDEYIYRMRHLVENAFAHLKQWRGIATRYAQNMTCRCCCSQYQMPLYLDENLMSTLSRVSVIIKLFFVFHFLLFLSNALARMISFRMMAVMATFGVFPV